MCVFVCVGTGDGEGGHHGAPVAGRRSIEERRAADSRAIRCTALGLDDISTRLLSVPLAGRRCCAKHVKLEGCLGHEDKDNNSRMEADTVYTTTNLSLKMLTLLMVK